jgi:hypothetical protein
MMTPVSIGHANRLPIDRLYKSYVCLGLAPQNESGSRTMPVAHIGAFEVRLIEFADGNRRGSLDLWIELYRHDTQSSIDSCLCRDLDEVETVGECFISQARRLCETNGVAIYRSDGCFGSIGAANL